MLSTARRRWGKEVFETFFVRTVMQCVEASLVDGKKIHVDSSLVDANASKDSVLKSSPELIVALKKAYGAQESKLENTSTPEGYEAVNDRMSAPPTQTHRWCERAATQRAHAINTTGSWMMPTASRKLNAYRALKHSFVLRLPKNLVNIRSHEKVNF